MGIKRTPARPRDARGRLLPTGEVATKTPPPKRTRTNVLAACTVYDGVNLPPLDRSYPVIDPQTGIAIHVIPRHTGPAGAPSVEIVPADATCVAASPQSGLRFFPCGAPAVAINENSDHVRGARCYAHAVVGVKELGEHIVVTTHPTLVTLKEVMG